MPRKAPSTYAKDQSPVTSWIPAGFVDPDARGAAPVKKPRKPRAPRVSRACPTPDDMDFISIDSEGFSEGAEREVRLASYDKTTGAGKYTYKEHNCAYLAASDGRGYHSEVTSETSRLSTVDCLEFLLRVQAERPCATLVCFSGTYDVTHMLRDLGEGTMEDLHKGKYTTWCPRERISPEARETKTSHIYRIMWRPRKELHIIRMENFRDGKFVGIDAAEKSKISVRLWDVWGFFQGTFVKALREWLPDDPDAQMILRMKAQRSQFTRGQWDEIRRYNDAELRTLSLIMHKLYAATRAAGLTLKRWDGAGAIASAYFRKHDVKSHMRDTRKLDTKVFTAARHAFSGGHIETVKIGTHHGTIYHYDINSAYPNEFRKLPSLSAGRWVGSGRQRNPLPRGGRDDFTMVRIRYDFAYDMPFYPLFFRNDDGSICYPRRGEGWYWRSEYEAALAYARIAPGSTIEVTDWYAWRSETDIKPFAWIEGYYQERKDIVAETKRTGVPNGLQMVIKIGLCSCYGKTAQQAGARIDYKTKELIMPSTFQLEYAGYVTAGCRATLMMAAIQRPHDIISFATDGIFSTAPLDLHCPKDKQLGAWEATTHPWMTVVMPGVYWYGGGGEDGMTGYSRGFDKDSLRTNADVLTAWGTGLSELRLPRHMMITPTMALTSWEQLWRVRGCFTSTVKTLQLTGDTPKRHGVSDSWIRQHGSRLTREMVPLRPREARGSEEGGAASDDARIISAPYSIKGHSDAGPADKTDEYTVIDTEGEAMEAWEDA